MILTMAVFTLDVQVVVPGHRATKSCCVQTLGTPKFKPKYRVETLYPGTVPQFWREYFEKNGVHIY